MPISRNQPGVATCDDCRSEKRPVLSWSITDNSDGLGYMGVGTVHLCAPCMMKWAAHLDALPPFLDVMRYELQAEGVSVPPKARYAEVRALYQEAGLEPAGLAPDAPAAPSDVPATPVTANDLVPIPTIPQLRRMNRGDLEVTARAHMPWLEVDTYSRDELANLLVEHFEQAVAGA
jgi:hypothetical protein